MIKQGTLNLINDNNEQIITKALSDIKIEMTDDEAGKQSETIGIEIFEKLLLELNKHTSALQNKVSETM